MISDLRQESSPRHHNSAVHAPFKPFWRKSAKCEICEQVLESKQSQEAIAWDWFTGYLPRTVHFCPDHKQSPLRNKLFKQSRDE